jgi:hypothetical protein
MDEVANEAHTTLAFEEAPAAEVIGQIHLDYAGRLEALDDFLLAETTFETRGGNVVIPVDVWESWMDRLSDTATSPYRGVLELAVELYRAIVQHNKCNLPKAKYRFVRKMATLAENSPELGING